MANTNDYLTNFFTEKEIPYHLFEIVDSDGYVHFIDTEFVIEAILQSSQREKQIISQTLRKLDFYNQPINDYLKHLANALVSRFNKAA